MASKEFAWSYSKLKNFETCPKRHLEVDLLKNFAEKAEPGGPLDWGNRLHDAMKVALLGSGRLPDEFIQYQPWVDKITDGAGHLYVEQKYAITRDFRKTSWFGADVWYRGIGDAVRVDGPVALVVDWKTGKVLEDHAQLMLMAQCIFSHFPEVQRVRSEYIWLKFDTTTGHVYDRQEVADEWNGMFNRVAELELAHKVQSYPPKPGKLCRNWCPVQSCPHWKKG